MKTLFFYAVVLGFVLLTNADEEGCFDKAKTDAEWRPLKLECKEKATATDKTERMWEVGMCMLKTKHLLTEDNEVDYPKYKESVLEVTVHHKEEIETLLTDCWANKGEETPTLVFFACAREKFHELCPDSKKWEEEDQEE